MQGLLELNGSFLGQVHGRFVIHHDIGKVAISRIDLDHLEDGITPRYEEVLRGLHTGRLAKQ